MCDRFARWPLLEPRVLLTCRPAVHVATQTAKHVHNNGITENMFHVMLRAAEDAISVEYNAWCSS
jgi:hypothetical protein